MIKINLLSQLRAKKIRKQAEIQYQLWLFGGFLVVLIMVLGYFWFYLDDRLGTLQGEKVTLEQNLAVLKEKVKEVQNYERDKNVFEEKIKVIKQLKANQSGPVHLLDQVSQTLPPRVWLIGLSQNGNRISIEGKALTNSELVDFIDALKDSRFFSDIQLLESRQGVEGGVSVYSFKLNCVMAI